MPNPRTTALFAAAAVSAAGALAAISLGGGEQARQEAVAERGAKVMPFSLDATTHVFDPTRAGGIQRVIADDARDREEIRLIREHLRKEALAFRRGDFGDPASIHGQKMPGLVELKAGYERIDVRYRELLDGAQITYRTADPSLAAAIRKWFDAQLRDHGDDAESGGHS